MAQERARDYAESIASRWPSRCFAGVRGRALRIPSRRWSPRCKWAITSSSTSMLRSMVDGDNTAPSATAPSLLRRHRLAVYESRPDFIKRVVALPGTSWASTAAYHQWLASAEAASGVSSTLGGRSSLSRRPSSSSNTGSRAFLRYSTSMSPPFERDRAAVASTNCEPAWVPRQSCGNRDPTKGKPTKRVMVTTATTATIREDGGRKRRGSLTKYIKGARSSSG